MQHWWFVLAAVGAAFAFAVSTHLKHLSAAQVPDTHDLHLGRIGIFIRASLVQRLWLAGIGVETLGLILQVTALHLGPFATVQPLLVLSLLFALLLRHRGRARMRTTDLGWAVLVTVSLVGFVALFGAGGTQNAVADPGPAIVGAAIGVLLAAGFVAAGRRARVAPRTAMLLGVAVGILYAGTAALLKILSDILVRHPVSVLWSWQLYAVLVSGAAGLLLTQLAFQAGPLTASLPAISTVEPLLSIVIGIWIFDEPIRHGIRTDAVLLALLLVLCAGVLKLAHTAPRNQ